jgi:hypothetical protein
MHMHAETYPQAIHTDMRDLSPCKTWRSRPVVPAGGTRTAPPLRPLSSPWRRAVRKMNASAPHLGSCKVVSSDGALVGEGAGKN